MPVKACLNCGYQLTEGEILEINMVEDACPNCGKSFFIKERSIVSGGATIKISGIDKEELHKYDGMTISGMVRFLEEEATITNATISTSNLVPCKRTVENKVKPILLAFSGKHFSGKTIVAKIIKEKLDEKLGWNSTMLMSLASPLKEMVYRGFKRSDRKAWQIFGTDVIRKGCREFFGTEDFLVNWMVSRMDDNPDKRVFIVDDVRYVDEVVALKSRGFFVVRLVCSAQKQQERALALSKEFLPEHITEKALDSREYDTQLFDLVVSGELEPEVIADKVISGIGLWNLLK